MAKEEETPEPVEKPESETPEPAEKPEGETPAEEDVSAKKAESETPAEEEVRAEQKGEAEESEVAQQKKAGEEISKEARMWAMICHLSGLAGCIFWVIGQIVGPLIIWQIKKDDYPFVDEQGKEAVNFQISMTIYGLISAVLTFICIGFFLLAAVVIVDIIFLLIAAVKANDGQHYRYPLTIRFIK